MSLFPIYTNAGQLITAYYMDLDILSAVQDLVHTVRPGFPDAIGTRTELDGPYDLKNSLYTATIIAAAVSGQEWATVSAGITILYNMVKSHYMQTVAYGVLDQEGLLGGLNVDGLGYDDYSW